MATTLKIFTARAAEIAVSVLIVRLIPAIAAGLVAAAHELDHQSAQAQAARQGFRS